MAWLYLRLIALAALALPAWAADSFDLHPKKQQTLGIRSAALGGDPGTARTGWPARIDIPSNRLRMVVAPVGGMLTQLNGAPGDRVKAGQTLAVLSSTELLAEQRGMMNAGARLKLARDNAARDEKLYADGIIAESRVRAARAEFTQAQAEYNAQRATLRAYGLGEGSLAGIGGGRLNTSLAVAAPLNGVILEQSATVGDRVQAGGPLYKIADLSRLVLDIQLPADHVPQVRIGQAVTVAGSQASGKVTAIGALVGGAQTLSVRAEIRDPQNLLRPGQQVEALLAHGAAAGQWQVPASALAWRTGRAHLFVVRPQGFRVVQVKVVAQSADRAVVSGALNGDEQIAVAGLAALKSIWLGGGE